MALPRDDYQEQRDYLTRAFSRTDGHYWDSATPIRRDVLRRFYKAKVDIAISLMVTSVQNETDRWQTPLLRFQDQVKTLKDQLANLEATMAPTTPDEIGDSE